MTVEIRNKVYFDDESYERAKEIADEMTYCCDPDDDYRQWDDLAADCIEGFLEDLDSTELSYTIHALKDLSVTYEEEHLNMALGIRAGLKLALEEMLSFNTAFDIDECDLDGVSEEDIERGREAYRIKCVLEQELERLEK